MIPEISPLAQQDIEDIATFTAGTDSEGANAIIQLLVSEILKIAENPGIGHFREDLAGKRFRFWLVGKVYYLVYFVEGEYVRIVRILHAARDVQSLLEYIDH